MKRGIVSAPERKDPLEKKDPTARRMKTVRLTQTNDNNGVVQPGKAVPYSQVIQDYNQMAHDAIDNSNVSPSEKDLVHSYFDTLEGQK